VALAGSKAGCLSFALYFVFFFRFLYGCGSFWAAWVGSSLGSGVCFWAFGWVTQVYFLVYLEALCAFLLYTTLLIKKLAIMTLKLRAII
jgi:hypothetical protein